MKVRELELPVEGIVRVMHPGAGIGLQFTNQTDEDQKRVEHFICTLRNSEGAIPEIEIRPDRIDNSPNAFSAAHTDDDPLLLLFHGGVELSAGEFYAELRKQRTAAVQQDA